MNKEISVIFNAFRSHIVEVCDNKSQRDTYIECDSPEKKATIKNNGKYITLTNYKRGL